VKSDTLGLPLLSSCAIHLLILSIGSPLVHHRALSRQDFLPISLVEVPLREVPASKKVPIPEIKKPLPPEPKVEKTKTPPPPAKAPALPTPAKEEPAQTTETKSPASAKVEPPPSFSSGVQVEGGGSAAGAGRLFGRGDVGVVPGSGTAGGGGGTAASGLGRGSGAPGSPAQVLRTNREAKPIQTVRANYPPMALRMGMESDVTLRIEVDAAGNVTRAEIVKSGGAGFDEEALKAVQQSRFEPAQKDGQNVPAEFTYIYRFRLQR